MTVRCSSLAADPFVTIPSILTQHHRSECLVTEWIVKFKVTAEVQNFKDSVIG